MTPFHAVIIAGGQGQRLGGVRKASIRIAGISMIDRVTAVLADAAQPILLASGQHGARMTSSPQYCAVSDIEGCGRGPLAGLVAAIAALQSRGITSGALISVAVDTPFLPPDYTSRLLAALATAPSAYAGRGEAFYPPNAAWRIEALAELADHANAIGSLKALHQTLGGKRVDWDGAAANPFDNLNTLDDLVALGKRAKGHMLL